MAELDDGPRLIAPLVLDPRKVPETKALELPHELDAGVVTTHPLIEAAVGSEGENASLNQHPGALEAIEHDDGKERTSLLAADSDLGGLDDAVREPISGRFASAIGINSSRLFEGSMRVSWVWSCSIGSTTARGSSLSELREVGAR